VSYGVGGDTVPATPRPKIVTEEGTKEEGIENGKTQIAQLGSSGPQIFKFGWSLYAPR